MANSKSDVGMRPGFITILCKAVDRWGSKELPDVEPGEVLEGGVPVEGVFKNADTVTSPFKSPTGCEWRPPSPQLLSRRVHVRTEKVTGLA